MVIGPTGRIDLTHVTSFESRQITQSVRVDRLDGTHMGTELPKGWEGSFELDRGSSAVDDFIAAAEQQYFNGNSITSGTMYQYVTETDGSTSTYQYDNVTFRLSNAGDLEGRQQRQAEAGVLCCPQASHLMNPSASIMAAAAATETVIDGDGRQLTIRRLTALDRLRLFKAAGPLLAQNQPWLGMALIASSVTAIDDVPVPPPSNEAPDRSDGRAPRRCGRCGHRAGIAAGFRTDRSRAAGQRGKLSRHPDLIDCLYLVRNGVPFDVAFSLPPDERMAFVVALGTLDGRVFDWQSLRWNSRA